MNENFLVTEDLMRRWNIKASTLRQWRWNGRGPIFIKIAGKIFYDIQDVVAFEHKMRRQSTAQDPFNPIS